MEKYTCGLYWCNVCLEEKAKNGNPPILRIFYNCPCNCYVTNCKAKYLNHIKTCDKYGEKQKKE